MGRLGTGLSFLLLDRSIHMVKPHKWGYCKRKLWHRCSEYHKLHYTALCYGPESGKVRGHIPVSFPAGNNSTYIQKTTRKTFHIDVLFYGSIISARAHFRFRMPLRFFGLHKTFLMKSTFLLEKH